MRAKGSALLAGGALLAVAVLGVGAWLIKPPQKSAEPTAVSQNQNPPAAEEPARPVVVPQADVPPEPTSADFSRDAPAPSTPTEQTGPIDWTSLPIDELRAKANAEDNSAMEELARRLLQGVGVTKDQQAGAGWLLRAAQHGSAQAAFNVGVMYERGFVVERDSVRAVEWYRKAVQANLPMAKHNLALMLRDGKGAPRDGKEAVELLRSASRQGMAASMFALGDIYERGDGTAKDPAIALAWFAIAAEFERQTNRDGESALGKSALQRAQALQRTLLPGELERAQQIGQREFKQIVEALQPPRFPAPEPTPPETAAAPVAPTADVDADPPGWPKTSAEQIRVIQQALVDLKLLRDKPDGVIGPMTRAAIKSFQKNVGARETGEPTKDVFVALQDALARRDSDSRSLDLGQPEGPPPPPTSADIEKAAPKAN
jgi:Putative peptidoglycan binding domain/Sel1 repeat